MSKKNPSILNSVDENSVVDYFAHFPAGDKSLELGAGKRYQQASYNGSRWEPFTPRDPSFKWRAGVCGDEFGSKDHLRGGQFYNGGRVSAIFTQNQVINLTASISVHHNGFFQAYVCDIKKCPGDDISESCFKRKACVPLRRAENAECDSGTSKKCGPIDRNYPGRWYLPCKSAARHVNTNVMVYGWEDGSIQYRLPYHMYCHHCVLFWYWTSANNCNPPGVREYFWGPDKPREWGECEGQGDAVGGFSKNERCGREFPEEYYNCADIRIRPK